MPGAGVGEPEQRAQDKGVDYHKRQKLRAQL
jgi:hypothetical protein